MSKLLKTWILAALFCLLLLLPQTVHAVQTELVVLDQAQDIAIALTYDVEEPDITILSPSGQIYSAEDDYDAVERGNYGLYLYIRNAPAGSWYIDYDKKNNTQLEATVMPWHHALTIDSLTIDSHQDSILSASAEVSCEQETDFQYYVYAVSLSSNGSTGGKRELGHGSGRSGRLLNIRVPTQELLDGTYHLQLEAYFTTDSGSEMPAYFITDSTFTVSGGLTLGDSSKFTSILNLTESTLYLDWSGAEEYATSWVLALYPAAPTTDLTDLEPLYYTSFEEGETNDAIILDEGKGDVRVELTGHLSSGGYILFTRDIIWKTDVTVAFETPERTNALRGAIRYDAAGHILRAVLTVNEESEQLQLTDNGILSLTLDPMEVNEVSLQYGWEDSSYYLISQRMAVDSIPPTLDLYGLSDQITVAENTVTISGGTEAGATLTVNGIAQAIEDNGNFLVELTLQLGANTILFEAEDLAGNKTSRTILVTYDPSGTVSNQSSDTAPERPWVLIASMIGALSALLFMGLFGTISDLRCKKDGMEAGASFRKLIAVLEGLFCSVVIGASALTTVFIFRSIDATSNVTGDNLLSALQQNTTQQIAEIIDQGTNYRTYGIICGVIAISALVVLVLLLILGRRFIRRYICPYCHNKVPPDSKFCESCGKKL